MTYTLWHAPGRPAEPPGASRVLTRAPERSPRYCPRYLGARENDAPSEQANALWSRLMAILF